MADTSYVPLTTIFTPPPECSTRLFTFRVDSTSSGTDYVFWDDAIQDETTLSCYPPEWITSNDVGASTFSPGVCPSDYTTVATTISDQVTVAFCCPSQFKASWEVPDSPGCLSTVGSSTAALAQSECTTSDSCVAYDYTILGTRTVSPSYAVAYAYIVAWEQTDLQLFTPKSAPILGASGKSISSYDYTAAFTNDLSSSTSSPSLSPGSTGPSVTTPTTTALRTPNSGSGGHGVFSDKQHRIGAEAGIVIGVLVLIAGCAWLFLRPRLRRGYST